jgi:hypothetical protein
MAAMQDEMSQLRGAVLVWYGIGQGGIFNRTPAYWKLYSAMPLRHAGCHVCVDTSKLDPIRWVMTKALESMSLCRVRFHHGKSCSLGGEINVTTIHTSIRNKVANIILAGSHDECMYEMMTFGIPREAFPILGVDGTMDLSRHHKLLESCKYIEKKGKRTEEPAVSRANSSSEDEQSKSSGSCSFSITTIKDEKNIIILIPSPMDVLMGRGRQPGSRPGSLRMHHLLEENFDAYEADTDQKTAITMNIIKEMKRSGCRFLRQLEEGGGYVEVDDSAVQSKLMHGFRSLRSKTKKKNSESTRDESETMHRAPKRNWSEYNSTARQTIE